MPYADHVFRIDRDSDGYTLAGRRWGPFASHALMEANLLDRLARWERRARGLGGWVWRRTPVEVVVTLPEGVAVRGGEPLTPWVRR